MAAAMRPLARSAFRTLPPTTSTSFLLRRCLSQETRTRIDSLVKARPLVVFMKGSPEMPQCGFSRATVQVLAAEGVERDTYDAHDVLADQEIRNGVKEYSEWPTIPQVYVDGEFLGGCDIMLEMYKNGELTKILEEKKITTPGARAKFEQDVLNS